MTPSTLTRSLAFLSSALFLATLPAAAQVAHARDDSHDPVQLRADLRDAVERDTDVANTVLVFNNVTTDVATVRCVAFDANGRSLGRLFAQIPPRGLRYLRASDFSSGADFIGSATCSSRGRVAASGVFLAPGSITDVDVIQAPTWGPGQILFPLIATY